MKTTAQPTPLIEMPIIILNAPPRAGKDTLGEKIHWELGGHHMEFKAPLLRLASQAMGWDLKTFMMFYNKEEGWKDTALDELNGHTVRELLIQISESMCKPFFGDDYFGKAAARTIKENFKKDELVYFTDGGFESEVLALVREVGRSIVVVRMHRSGCDYSGDSRSYLPDNPLYYDTIDIDNNGTIQETMDGLITGLIDLGYEGF